MRYNKNLLIASLIIVILVLLGVITYIFAIKPAIINYVVGTQNQGAQLAVNYIADIAKQCQTIPINIGGNQTINLIAIECLQTSPG
ncbi:MAG: hypothetical protein IIA85_00830 [Nanoarchaeota archaeon]|nr:hypothetical protein [Nanoarchaeota archaeon]